MGGWFSANLYGKQQHLELIGYFVLAQLIIIGLGLFV